MHLKKQNVVEKSRTFWAGRLKDWLYVITLSSLFNTVKVTRPEWFPTDVCAFCMYGFPHVATAFFPVMNAYGQVMPEGSLGYVNDTLVCYTFS